MAEKKKKTTVKVVDKLSRTSMTSKQRANTGAEKGVLAHTGIRRVRPLKKKEN